LAGPRGKRISSKLDRIVRRKRLLGGVKAAYLGARLGVALISRTNFER
jgi:hypothetical protein